MPGIPNIASVIQEATTEALTVDCAASFEAGRAASKCAFYSEVTNDSATELAGTLGAFLSALGGDWKQLGSQNDVDAWVDAADHLLESLPPEHAHIAHWYELGYQFTLICSMAEDGLPSGEAGLVEYKEGLQHSTEEFWRAAEEIALKSDQAVRIQRMLDGVLIARCDDERVRRIAALATLRLHAEDCDGERRASEPAPRRECLSDLPPSYSLFCEPPALPSIDELRNPVPDELSWLGALQNSR